MHNWTEQTIATLAAASVFTAHQRVDRPLTTWRWQYRIRCGWVSNHGPELELQQVSTYPPHPPAGGAFGAASNFEKTDNGRSDFGWAYEVNLRQNWTYSRIWIHAHCPCPDHAQLHGDMLYDEVSAEAAQALKTKLTSIIVGTTSARNIALRHRLRGKEIQLI
jgi:hypothetical protein